MRKSDNILALIPARGGSKGIPRKNIKMLGGKPLISHSIETALASQLITRVVVSTDDDEIAFVSAEYGAEIPFIRPNQLATDDSPEWLTWQHASRELGGVDKFDVFVCVSPTAPLRSVNDIDKCIRTLLNTDADLVITVKPADRNPYFNMVTIDSGGYAALAATPSSRIYRRQDAPQMFDITTVAYAALPEFIMQNNSPFDGKVKAVEVPPERAVDIDTNLDFQVAELLLNRNRV